jgi:small-conductance mechanosensitive channel
MEEKKPEHRLIREEAKSFLSAAKWPSLTIIIIYAVYFSAVYTAGLFFPSFRVEIKSVLDIVAQIGVILSIYWFFLKIISLLQLQLEIYLRKSGHKSSIYFLNFFSNTIKIIIFLSLFSFVINLFPLPSKYTYFADKLVGILIVIAIAVIFVQLVKLIEELIVVKYNIDEREDLLAQKARTQILIFRRIAITLITFVSVGASLLLFENVRNLGTSILTSAGVISVVIAFTIQKPLQTLGDSLPIIFNQLIKINDYLVVEGEFGQVEEINLYYVIIKIWDLRRLILPISYFVQKPFINLSRTSTEILGTVFLHVDYSLPIESVREALINIVNGSPLWDKKTCDLQVVGAKEFCMEVRIVVGARNPGDAWNLQCFIREKLLKFIQENYPGALPQLRTTMMK